MRDLLRVPESEEPLDRTGVHPESYPAAQKLLTLCGYQTQDLLEGKLEQLAQRVAQMGQAQVAQRIGVGEPTAGYGRRAEQAGTGPKGRAAKAAAATPM